MDLLRDGMATSGNIWRGEKIKAPILCHVLVSIKDLRESQLKEIQNNNLSQKSRENLFTKT